MTAEVGVRCGVAGAVLGIVVAIAGCGGERQPVAEVTGRVTLEGKPLAGVVVQFEPRAPDAKQAVPASYGITDANGRYRAFRTGNKKFGAVVGVSQVRITVPEGNSARVHPRYSADRAFWAEINPGSNVFDLDLVQDPTKARLQVEEPPAR
ncbi:MAG: hypothetical protein EBZ74_03795 [Planctomycetia bacterium]|nr:hypothetical protein [Planctomycetia bacterium]